MIKFLLMTQAKRNRLFNRQNIIISLFVLLSTISFFTPYFKIDLHLSEKIQSINSIIFSNVMWLVSSMGNYPYMLIVIGITCLLLYLFKYRTEASICLLSTMGSALSGSLIKLLIDRPRPTSALVQVSVFFSDKSYPSNHVLIFTVFFGFLLYLLLKSSKQSINRIILSIIFIMFIGSIGISRIYLGAHWPSDVIGGYLFGIIWLIFTIKLYNSINGKR